MTTRTFGTEGAKPVNLKVLAEYLSLSPATISLVMNNAPGAKSIAPATRERVLAAAKKLDYRPNPIARSLRTRQTFTVGVIVPEFSEGYFTMLMNGIEENLLQAGYLHFVVSHQGRADLIEEYPSLLRQRSVDGFLLVNTELNEELSAPVVSISGHKKIKGHDESDARPRPRGATSDEAPVRPGTSAHRVYEGSEADWRRGEPLAGDPGDGQESRSCDP